MQGTGRHLQGTRNSRASSPERPNSLHFKRFSRPSWNKGLSNLIWSHNRPLSRRLEQRCPTVPTKLFCAYTILSFKVICANHLGFKRNYLVYFLGTVRQICDSRKHRIQSGTAAPVLLIEPSQVLHRETKPQNAFLLSIHTSIRKEERPKK